jgi:hypothetical protein
MLLKGLLSFYSRHPVTKNLKFQAYGQSKRFVGFRADFWKRDCTFLIGGEVYFYPVLEGQRG